MIRIVKGNLLKSQAVALVNTVNTVGVMGKGIALQFKKAFPENYREYKYYCDKGELKVGMVLVTQTRLLQGPKYIINFPTKQHWKGQSKLEHIEIGLVALVNEVQKLGINSIAIPPLGCGLGGLSWSEVRSKIERAFIALPDVDVELYAPVGAPRAESMANSTSKPNITRGRAALLGLLDCYKKLLFFETPTLLEVQKLSYFLQVVGEPLRLNFQKGPYGPYADNLRHVLNKLEGHYISGWGDGQNKPDQPIEILPDVVEDVQNYLEQYPDTKARFKHVAALVEGFETPYGMELLGTVHWVATNEVDVENRNVRKVAPLVQAWTKRKGSLFSPKHIGVALEHLRAHNII